MTEAEFHARVVATAREIAIRRATVLRAAGRTDGFSPGSMTAAIYDATEIETVLRDYLRDFAKPAAQGYGPAPECDGSVKP